MNRRKAIFRIFLTGAGATAAFTGYKGYHILKTPDLSYLDSHKDLIGALTETIIPTTDTPGAIEAGVPAFLVMMIKDGTSKKTQNKFIDGLKDVESYSKSKFNKGFVACTAAEKESVLAHFEKKGKPFSGILGKVEHKFLGDSFFTTLRDLTVKGYCTSKIGATQALAYDYIPGPEYKGCIPLQPGQKSWATQ